MFVLVFSVITRNRGREGSQRLSRSWEGHYVVVKQIDDVVVRINKRPQAKPKVVHINWLKPYAGEAPFGWFVKKEHWLMNFPGFKYRQVHFTWSDDDITAKIYPWKLFSKRPINWGRAMQCLACAQSLDCAQAMQCHVWYILLCKFVNRTIKLCKCEM